jgi:glycosyltransferase involved in cell wall biosynthesis
MQVFDKAKLYDQVAEEYKATGRRKNRYYYNLLARAFSFYVSEGSSVLELGCGWGSLLKVVNPAKGVGIDSNTKMIELARQVNPDFEFIHANVEEYAYNEKFDFILISDLLNSSEDIWKIFRNLKGACKPETRIIISQYNYLWMPALRVAERLGLKRSGLHDHWLGGRDIEAFLRLNGFELVSESKETLLPVPLPFISDWINRWFGRLPLIRALGLVQMLVARPRPEAPSPERTVSIIIPTRNEKDNIKGAVKRTPMLGAKTELIFVDGSSTDGTVEEIEKYIEEYKGVKDISLIHQVSPGDADYSGKMLKLGKGDAVRKGFDAAKHEILIILDSDLTVAPEDLEKFYLALKEGHCDFANGSRLVYRMESNAMRSLNVFANYLFGKVFSYLLGQSVKDTLCGTKCLSRDTYMNKIAPNRKFFGDFDPFGDFDLLFGAAKLHLKILDVPIRYRERVYGDIKIRRFRHGVLLLRMCLYAFFKLILRM